MEVLHSTDTLLELKPAQLRKVKEIKSAAINSKKEMEPVISQIVQCVNLERLSLYSTVAVTFPEAFFALKKLSYLRIHNLRSPKVFLENVGKLTNLKTLYIKHAKFDAKKAAEIWANIGSLGLFDDGTPKDTTIWHLHQLENLFLPNCRIKLLPAQIQQLTHLKRLDIRRSKLIDFPESILLLPQLQELYTDDSILENPEPAVEEYLQKLPYYYQQKEAETKYIDECLLYFPKYEISDELRVLAMQLLADNAPKIKALQNLSLLLKATQIPHFDMIRIRATQYLAQLYGQKAAEYLGKEKPVITICGKIHTNKNDLRKRLKEQGIGYKAKLHESTTHIVMGQSYKGDLEALNKPQYHFLSEYALNDYLDQVAPQYLVADDSITDQLKQLLLANDENAVELAFELIKTGGLPKDCITELFICWIALRHGKLFNKAQKYLRQIGSPQLGDLVKTWISGVFNSYTKYQPTEYYQYQELCRFEKYEELDALRIAWYTYRNYGVGVKYLINRLKGKDLFSFLKEHCNGTSIDLSGLELPEIPSELFELDFLSEINLHHNKLSNIDVKAFRKLRNLQKLTLTHNKGIKKKERPTIQMQLSPCEVQFVE